MPAARLQVIPAIDLRDGRCVRLYQGDYSRERIFADNPADVARHWVSEGATRLHVVDLDGAREGQPANAEAVRAIVEATGVPVQLGGGLRTLEAIEGALALGVERVILGTVAVESPEVVAEAVKRWGEAIIVGVDAREGKLAVRGWREGSELTAIDLIRKMESAGVARFIYTDIARDGTLTEPNYAALAEVLAATRRPVIASGGVAELAHLERLAALGVEGAIVGMALYAGTIDLHEAIATVGDNS